MAQLSIHSQAPAAPSQAGISRSKTRSACDRCHQQKLRCIKTRQQTTCERCARLAVECCYSPRERRIVRNGPFGRPFRTGPDAWSEPRDLAPAIAPEKPDMQQSVTAVPGSVEHDWIPFQNAAVGNAEALGCLNPDTISPMQMDSARALVTGPTRSGQLTDLLNIHSLDHGDGAALDLICNRQTPTLEVRDDCTLDLLDFHEINDNANGLSYGLGHPLNSTAGRLTSLSTALYECASKLPSIKASRAESGGTVNFAHATGSRTKGDTLLVLDEVFRATDEFINIMKYMCPIIDPQEIPTPPSYASTTEASLHLTHGMNTALLPFFHFDEATMLLFLSCHYRLTDIYESIFQAIQRCIKGPHAASHPTAGVILPQLQVGGFGGVSSPALRVDFSGPPLPPATVSLYLGLTTTISSQMWAQIRDAMRREGRRNGLRDRPPMTHLEIADPAWDIAVKRTDDLTLTIETIRNSL
ncbi:hypothetical protein F5Y12DRAFT_694961 [Xylaria sp. FL1777]|nr:hypothetical protein F5Y12DRAFT_694961 [Xylaria sp. FL1777]